MNIPTYYEDKMADVIMLPMRDDYICIYLAL